MFKKFLAALVALFLAAAAHAAVDVNRASQAELEAVKGIGPTLSTQIVSERKKAEFEDWSDFVGRVKGVGGRSAAKFSEGGLTVQGKAYAAVAQAGGNAKAGKAKGKGGKTAEHGEPAKKTRASSANAMQR